MLDTTLSLLKNFEGYYDGQFRLDINKDVLQQEFCKDLQEYSSISNAFVLENSNGLIAGEKLIWDSNYFGVNCFKLTYLLAKEKKGAQNLIKTYLDWAKEYNGQYILCRTETTNLLVLNTLIRNNFELLFNKAMLRLLLNDYNLISKQTADSDSIEIISYIDKYNSFTQLCARKAFIYNRFVNDENINQMLIPGMYEQWVQQYTKNKPDNIGIALIDQQPLGMVIFDDALLNYKKNHWQDILKSGIISLIAVEPTSQGKGIGYQLLKWAITKLKEVNCTSVYANTALENTSSLLMFQKAGFKVYSTLTECRLFIKI